MSARDRFARLARLRAIEVGGAARTLHVRRSEALSAAGSLARIDSLLVALTIERAPTFARDLAAAAGQRARLREARVTASARADHAEARATDADRAARLARARAETVDRLRNERRVACDRLVERREHEDATAVARPSVMLLLKQPGHQGPSR